VKLPVYLDYAATTPVDPRVAARMAGFLTADGVFGNPASRAHRYGWQAEAAVEEARAQVAAAVNADPREIVWTSGATEADNLALKGCAAFYRDRGRHLVTSRIEHKAVLDTCAWLATQGFEITYLDPDAEGLIAPAAVARALRPDTILVSIMHVNNELGTINDIAAIGALCRERKVLYHVDAAQSIGKVEVDLGALPVDLLSLSAHKAYGPKGIGALYVRRSGAVRLQPQMHGGGHERGLRSGTLPTHQIVAMGEAFRLAAAELAADRDGLEALRAQFRAALADLPGVYLNGSRRRRVPGIVNLSFAGIAGESLLLGLKDVAASSGSACTSASLEPSHVLRALGVPEELAHATLRFSFGRFTGPEEIERAAAAVRAVVTGLRGGATEDTRDAAQPWWAGEDAPA
jgi:cysteine desulfurase